METPLILIVGAGPAGTTVAVELKRVELDVYIIDKSGPHVALFAGPRRASPDAGMPI
jgi:2-polyprenyl-6-methoxyphenol hydroxylase-like FAD-dependent oxidoreductase